MVILALRDANEKRHDPSKKTGAISRVRKSPQNDLMPEFTLPISCRSAASELAFPSRRAETPVFA
jgi:hypothetical protein